MTPDQLERLHDLSERLELATDGDKIKKIAVRMNELLDEILATADEPKQSEKASPLPQGIHPVGMISRSV